VTGLVARTIEAAGIPTVVISISREVTERVKPPRAIVLRFPFGHATGEPGHIAQQRRIVLEALHLLESANGPAIVSLDHLRWRRTDYASLPPVQLAAGELR
jgi:hypothetical protein